MSSQASARDWHGVRRAYRRRSDGETGSSLRALAPLPLRLDRRGVASAWGLACEPDRTPVDGVWQLPCAPDPSGALPEETWSATFEAAVARIAVGARAPALALGGGVDGAAVLFAWAATGAPLPAVVTLATGLGGYDEVPEAAAVARSAGARCEILSVRPDDVVDLLPDAIAAAETPLYNLHPVSRFALARAAHARGYETLVTGDGADAAFVARPDHDYVPIVASLTHAAEMTLASPFFDEAVLAATLARGRDPSKGAVRQYLAGSGVPGWLGTRPKVPRWMPPLDLSRHVDRPRLESLARALGLELRLDSDPERVRWVTLDLLTRAMEPVT